MGLFTFLRKMTDGVADALNANFKRVHLDTFQGYSTDQVPDFVAGASYLQGNLARSGGGNIYACIAEVDDATLDPANDPAHWQLVVFAIASAPGLTVLRQSFQPTGPSFSLAPLPRSIALVFGDGGLQAPESYSLGPGGVLTLPNWQAFQDVTAWFVPASQASSHDMAVDTFNAGSGPNFKLSGIPVGGWMLVFGDDALQPRSSWALNGTVLTLGTYATFQTVSVVYVASDQPQYLEFAANTGPVFALSPKPLGRMLMVFGDGRLQPKSSYSLSGSNLTLPAYATFQTVSVAYI
ncbi:MAG TPA: hypothetical protein VFA75_05310 [Nevskia sp.]|nr:hypothetical protein [Nevskia sp.]